MTPTPDDVLAAVQTRLSAAGVTALVPGLVWFGRRPDGGAMPYGVVGVEEGEEEERDSAGGFVKRWTVEVVVYASSTDSAAPDTTAIRTALDAALAPKFSDPASALVVPNAVAVRESRVLGGRLSLEARKRQGQDVVAAAGRYEITTQGRRR